MEIRFLKYIAFVQVQFRFGSSFDKKTFEVYFNYIPFPIDFIEVENEFMGNKNFNKYRLTEHVVKLDTMKVLSNK